MTWGQRDINAGRWRTCDECGERYNDRNAHYKLHFDRPSDQHMTANEVAAAVGRNVSVVRDWIKKGRLRADRTPLGKIRLWVTREALKSFVTNAVEGDLRKAVTWAETGKVA